MNTGTSEKRSSATAFFSLVFALSSPFWALGAITGIQLRPGLPLSSLSIITPVAAALFLIRRENKIAGMTELLKRSLDFKRIRTKAWYAPVILLMPGIMGVEYALMRILRWPVPPLHFTVPEPLPLFVVFFIAALGEELGWMGYAFDRLRGRWNALQVSLLLGMVWAAWHSVLLAQAHRSLAFIVWQSGFYVSARILLVWLYESSGRSVFAAAVCHAMFNVSWLMFPVGGSFYDPQMTCLITAFTAAVVLFLWGPETLARFRYARKEQGRPSSTADGPVLRP